MLGSKTVARFIKILFFTNIINQTLSAKILAVFPVPSISHQVVFRPLTQELARRGHEVTVITPNPAFPRGGAPERLKEIDVHDVSYKFWRRLQEKYEIEQTAFLQVREFGKFMINLLDLQLKTPEVQKIISDKKDRYDLIFIEAVISPALIFSHVFKAPVILLSSFGSVLANDNMMGAASHPILYPSSLSTRSYNLSISEKLGELYKYYSTVFAMHLNEADENEYFQRVFGAKVTPTSELYNNVDMLFLNTHPMWADNRPVPWSVVYIGGIHQIPEKELPKDLKSYLDSSKHGVIYLSFGTNVLADMIPVENVKIFIEVLSQLPYDVLWKWDKDELPKQANNIKISKWYPQSDLLKHPNIKLFITQAGLQSTDEAISAGVPLVAVPMFGDQWYNAEKYVKYGIGKKLDMLTLTAKELKAAVESVIRDGSYKKNIIKLRGLMSDQPEAPLQRAVWWTEYVMRHGGAKHLRSPAANISYAQYFELELIGVVLFAALTIFVLVILVIYFVIKYLLNVLHVKPKFKLN